MGCKFYRQVLRQAVRQKAAVISVIFLESFAPFSLVLTHWLEHLWSVYWVILPEFTDYICADSIWCFGSTRFCRFAFSHFHRFSMIYFTNAVRLNACVCVCIYHPRKFQSGLNAFYAGHKQHLFVPFDTITCAALPRTLHNKSQNYY